MKKIFLLLTLLFTLKIQAQSPVSIVNDPVSNLELTAIETATASSNGILTNINLILGQMRMADKLKMSADFIKNLQTVERIYSAMETLICQIDGLRLEASRSTRAKDCFFNMQQEISLLNVNLSSDLMKLAVIATASFKTDFTAADKVDMLTEICTNIEQASIQLENLQHILIRENITLLSIKGSKIRNNKALASVNRYR